MSLVLTRRPGEKILIGDNITITFQGYNGNSAVLAIDAPRDIAIVREEIKDKKFEPKQPVSEKKPKAPFLKAHRHPKGKTIAQAVASATEVIRDEVRSLG